MKSAAFFDLDNTLIRGSSLMLLGRGLISQGYISRSELTKYVFQNLKFVFSKTENLQLVEKLIPRGLKIISGMFHSEVVALCDALVGEMLPAKLNELTAEMVNWHNDMNHHTWIVTASPIEIAAPIAERLGMTGALGTICEVDAGTYSGKLLSPILHGSYKAAAIEKLCSSENYDLNQAYFYSDSVSDLPALTCVGNPVVVNPNPHLKSIAMKNHWRMIEGTNAAA
ncbi:MAG: phosphoserine phosphatase [Actinomycetota bacterium]|jgi:HAD superfamily hydrolase (TIGR01490 family)